jgi:hypothetical protein
LGFIVPLSPEKCPPERETAEDKARFSTIPRKRTYVGANSACLGFIVPLSAEKCPPEREKAEDKARFSTISRKRTYVGANSACLGFIVPLSPEKCPPERGTSEDKVRFSTIPRKRTYVGANSACLSFITGLPRPGAEAAAAGTATESRTYSKAPGTIGAICTLSANGDRRQFFFKRKPLTSCRYGATISNINP